MKARNAERGVIPEPTLCKEVVHETLTYLVDQEFLNACALSVESPLEARPVIPFGDLEYVCTCRWGGRLFYDKGELSWTGAIGAELTMKCGGVFLVGQEWMKNTGAQTVDDAEFDRAIFAPWNIERVVKAQGYGTIEAFKALPRYQQRAPLIAEYLKQQSEH